MSLILLIVHLNKAILRKFETFHRKKRVTFVCVGSYWIEYAKVFKGTGNLFPNRLSSF